ncbi:MAG: thermonuclease family protein [Phycisphaerae bacterium]
MLLRRQCPLLSVADGDTIKIEWEGKPRLVRLMDVDPESAGVGGSKPTTDFGRRTLLWARQIVFDGVEAVEIEFPGDEVELSNCGALLGYVHVHGENYNVRLVREGWSLCFDKYGAPRIHRAAMEQAELWARAEGRGLWGGLGGRGDYRVSKSYFRVRAGQVEAFRHAAAMGEDILSSRLHYHDIVARARAGTGAHVFAEISRSFFQPDGAITFQLGSPRQPLEAVFPRSAVPLARFLEREFAGFGKPNYLYFSGRLAFDGERPQILIERLDQVRTYPTRS